MKLWRISQDVNNDYDTYDALIVAAETEEEAKNTHPYGSACWQDRYGVWAKSPDEVKAELIGEAGEGINAGLILGSFNAG